jgi:hypothetical protein
MDGSSDDNRLPPPAFPPNAQECGEELDAGSPDAANRRSNGRGPHRPSDSSFVDGAIIDPDDPFPLRDITLTEDFGGASSESVVEDGEVVGMDLSPHLSREEIVSRGDPHLMELIGAVSKLAEGLRRKGEAGLHAAPSMSRFEATLRAYCVGFLAGRRSKEPPVEPRDQALPSDG